MWLLNIRLLFIGALEYEKGLDIITQLSSLLDSDKVEFHVAGGGLLAQQVKNNRNIIYHGVVDEREKAELYRNSDVLIYPSCADTFSLVILEALASGLYVLADDFFKGV